MLVSMEIVFDREPTGESASSVTRVRWALVGSGALLAIVIALAVLRVSEPTSRRGAQAIPASSFVLEQAAFDGWEPLEPTAGALRAGFPAPMVWKEDRVCIGLARTDFGPEDFRPSTARCERQRAENMAANEIRSLLSIRSGFDTWHFIEAPGDIDFDRLAEELGLFEMTDRRERQFLENRALQAERRFHQGNLSRAEIVEERADIAIARQEQKRLIAERRLSTRIDTVTGEILGTQPAAVARELRRPGSCRACGCGGATLDPQIGLRRHHGCLFAPWVAEIERRHGASIPDELIRRLSPITDWGEFGPDPSSPRAMSSSYPPCPHMPS